MKAKILIDSYKAPGSDATLAKIYKAGGPQVAGETELFHIMWRNEAIPQKFKDASIIHLFKSLSLCASHWGISFFVKCLEDSNKSEWTPWTDSISTREQMWGQEEHRNNWHYLYSKAASREMSGKDMDFSMNFVDFTKAVVRDFERLWQI